MEKLFNLIQPPHCIVCGEKGEHLCNKCFSDFRAVSSGFCLVCGKDSEEGNTHSNCLHVNYPLSIVSLFRYEGNLRVCIKYAKYSRRLFHILKVIMQKGLIDKKDNIKENYSEFYCVSVPSAKSRMAYRGFNQTDIIRDELSRFCGLKVLKNVCTRKKETSFQYDKSRKDRYKNLENAFLANRRVFGKKILVVDDICTSGATLVEMSKALYLAGASEVRCFTLAKKF